MTKRKEEDWGGIEVEIGTLCAIYTNRERRKAVDKVCEGQSKIAVINFGSSDRVADYYSYSVAYRSHPSGSRDCNCWILWINYRWILTLYGVWWKIEDNQQARSKDLESQYKPILKFSTSTCCVKNHVPHPIFTLCCDEFCTSEFPEDGLKNYPIIEVSLQHPIRPLMFALIPV